VPVLTAGRSEGGSEIRIETPYPVPPMKRGAEHVALTRRPRPPIFKEIAEIDSDFIIDRAAESY
jgi:hypothetical protein